MSFALVLYLKYINKNNIKEKKIIKNKILIGNIYDQN